MRAYTMGNMALVEAIALTKNYAHGTGAGAKACTVVDGVSLEIEAGETLGLVGESGSGKSVSALALLRLLPPQARIRGSIQFRGEELLALSEPEMRRIRGAGISMIFQEPMTALNPVMRVGDQIAEAVLAHAGAKAPINRGADTADLKVCPFKDDQPSRGSKLTKADAWRLAVEAMRTVSIADADRRARDYPHQLSPAARWAFATSGFNSAPSPGLSVTCTKPSFI